MGPLKYIYFFKVRKVLVLGENLKKKIVFFFILIKDLKSKKKDSFRKIISKDSLISP